MSPPSRLDLSRQGLISVPESVYQQSHLTHLMLGWNELTELEPLIGGLTSLTHLYVHDNPLRSLPDQLNLLINLEVLDTSHNRKLTTLPSRLNSLNRLRFLYAAELALTEVPVMPTSLEYLNLGDNQLIHIDLGDLPHLLELRLGINQLSTVPDSIGGLRRLRELHLDHNPLTVLPSLLGTLTDLRLLSLRGCRLSALPDLSELEQLHSLDLRANAFATLPSWLGALPSLERLDLRWNGFDAPPAQLAPLIERGCRIYY